MYFDSLGYQVVDDGVFGTFNIHLEQIDMTMPQLGQQRWQSPHLHFDCLRPGRFAGDEAVRNKIRVIMREKRRGAIVVRNRVREEPEFVRHALTGQPRNRSRSWIEGKHYWQAERSNQRYLERDIISDSD